LLGLTALSVIASCMPVALHLPMLLIWNVSGSAPRGLYRVTVGELAGRGDWVAIRLPEPVSSLAARRRYLPHGIPAIKRVAAISGDRVCASGEFIRINGNLAAIRMRADMLGRALPRWQGCKNLQPGELFLLNDDPKSFDSRYFGSVPKHELVGRVSFL
jgi:conjugative transfer signal peptidase TraF